MKENVLIVIVHEIKNNCVSVIDDTAEMAYCSNVVGNGEPVYITTYVDFWVSEDVNKVGIGLFCFWGQV